MNAHDALQTARRIAAQLDLIAYIYTEDDAYQVACMDYASLTERQRRDCIAVVHPDTDSALFVRRDQLA